MTSEARSGDNLDCLVGVTFDHPHTGMSYKVESVVDGVATMVRREIVDVRRVQAEWSRDAEMDELRKMMDHPNAGSEVSE